MTHDFGHAERTHTVYAAGTAATCMLQGRRRQVMEQPMGASLGRSLKRRPLQRKHAIWLLKKTIFNNPASDDTFATAFECDGYPQRALDENEPPKSEGRVTDPKATTQDAAQQQDSRYLVEFRRMAT